MKLIPKLIFGLSILLLIYEILSLDFDNLGQSISQNFLSLIVPILLLISSLINIRDMRKMEQKANT